MGSEISIKQKTLENQGFVNKKVGVADLADHL
jgi:hypothetical protein